MSYINQLNLRYWRVIAHMILATKRDSERDQDNKTLPADDSEARLSK